MLAYVKKIHRHSDELLHLALILSLIRVDPESYLGLGFGRRSDAIRGTFHNITMGDTWAHMPSDSHRLIEVPYLHPKSMEASLAQYQEEIIEHLNDLGRYTSMVPSNSPSRTFAAYLLDEIPPINHDLSTPNSAGVSLVPASPSSSMSSSTAVPLLAAVHDHGPATQGSSQAESTSELSLEDADLIEILWKQDIDIGIPRDHFLFPSEEENESGHVNEEEALLKEKLNASGQSKPVEDKDKHDKKKNDEKTVENASTTSDDNPWAGLSYRIDDETGEYILLERSEASSSSDSGCETDSFPAPETEEEVEQQQQRQQSDCPLSLDKALGFVDFDSNDFDEEKLTESNFTLGALSPEGAELIGSDDPLLGSISAPVQPAAAVPVAHNAVSLLLTEENSPRSLEQSLLNDPEFDLGFYFSDDQDSDEENIRDELASAAAVVAGADQSSSCEAIDILSEQLEASLEDMIQTAQMHPRSLQVRMPLMRTMSMEHRWQDLANFLSLPDGAAAAAAAANRYHDPSHPGHYPHAAVSGHHHHAAAAAAVAHHSHHHSHPPPPPPHHHSAVHSIGAHHPHSTHPHPFAHPGYPHGSVHHANGGYTTAHHGYGGMAPAATPVSTYPANSSDVSGRSVLLHNASIGSPLTEIGGNGSYPSSSLGSGVTLGSAVTASMNLTNSTEGMEASGQIQTYKTESTQPDMHLYYHQNNTAEVNQTGDGFFPSIFNEDDLQLMDMAITDTMYTPRLLENQTVGHGLVLNNGSTASGGNATVIPSTVIDTTNDSAVSSMGSERGPSISDGDWIDSNATDSNATSSIAGATAVLPSGSAYGMEYSSGGKYRHYDYGYSSRSNGMDGGVSGGRGSGAPVAQKKHHMFGKRVFHDQNDLPGSPSAVAASSPAKFDYGSGATANIGPIYSHPSTPLDGTMGMNSMEMKYGCGMDYNPHSHDIRGMDNVNHNHTYALGSEASGTSQRPVSRDKHRAHNSSLRGSVSDTSSIAGAGTSGSCSESEAYSRDEKRARSMNIPMTVDDIINLPMDEFNERLSKYDLTEPQLSLIRDIRRRGKNKVAAQNCRKRKLDQILTLADEVKRARERKIRLNKERDFLVTEKARIKDRFAQLYRHVFQSLRDSDGQPYSPYEYSLQQSADGNILLVPRANAPHGGVLDPQPSLHHQQHLHAQRGPMMEHQHHQHHLAQQAMAGGSSSSQSINNNNASTSAGASGVHHGARRKTPDHKNEP